MLGVAPPGGGSRHLGSEAFLAIFAGIARAVLHYLLTCVFMFCTGNPRGT